MNLPENWRLPPRRAKALPRSSLLERPTTGAALWRGMRFHQDRTQHHEAGRATVEFATVKRGSPETDVWPWELQAPAFWQSGARFWRRKKQPVNPFEAAFEFAATQPRSNSSTKPAA